MTDASNPFKPEGHPFFDSDPEYAKSQMERNLLVLNQMQFCALNSVLAIALRSSPDEVRKTCDDLTEETGVPLDEYLAILPTTFYMVERLKKLKHYDVKCGDVESEFKNITVGQVFKEIGDMFDRGR